MRERALVLFVLVLAPALAGPAAGQGRRAVPAGGPPAETEGLQPRSLSSRGDVLVLVADDVNWYDVDNVATPNLDRLMAAGSTWRRFYSFPVCSPTRYALQYGRWPRRDGILGVLESVNGEVRSKPHPDEALASIGDLFQGQGFLSGFFGKWHTGLQFYGPGGTANPLVTPLFIGYDTWRAGTGNNVIDYFLWDRIDDGTETQGVMSYIDEELIDTVGNWWLANEPSRRRRFAFVGFHLAHAPFHAPPAYLLPPGHPAPETTREEFECMVMAMDSLIDRLIRFDDDDPDGEVDLETTLVVLVGDNGTPSPAAGPQPATRVKGTTYEGGIRTPLILAGPGFQKGELDTTSIVSPVDLFATFSTWLGIPRPRGVAEDSIPIQKKARTWTMSERVFMQDDFAIVLDFWKLRRVDGIEELFDLASDPDELSPLDPNDPAHAEVVAQIRSIEEGLPPRALGSRRQAL